MFKKLAAMSLMVITLWGFISVDQTMAQKGSQDKETLNLDYGGDKIYHIGVFFWHESGNDFKTFEGVIEGFKLAGLSVEFYIRQAFGNAKTAQEVVTEFKNKHFDLIYAMGTEATLLLMKDIDDVPIVFTAVTNPVESKITPNWETSGRNVTGNSNWINTEDILKTFKDAVPNLKSLGVMYDPDNAVSAMEVRVAKKILETSKELGIKRLEEVHVKNVSDLQPACQSLGEKVEALWVPIDFLVYSNLQEILPITVSKKIPVLSSSHRGVKDGAMIGLIVDYLVLGKLSVPLVHQILTQGIKPQDIPIGRMKDYKIMVNLKAAKEIGYKIPLPVLSVADVFIK